MHKPMTAHELEVYRAELTAADRRRNADPVYKAQTATLQWLRRLGHAVDFSTFTPETPGRPSVFFVPHPLAAYDGRPCPYCGKEMRLNKPRHPTRDHVKPRSKGGKLKPGNKLIVCRPCNGDKGSKTLKEWVERLTALEDPRAGVVQNLIDRGAP